MLSFRSPLSLVGWLTASALFVSAQMLPRQASALPEPALPADPLELVTGDAQPVQSADGRASAIRQLSHAYVLSNVRAYPYDRKTTFTTFGSTSSDGNWQMEDMTSGTGLYRWTAQGPAYSAINLYQNQMLYSNQSSPAIPVRLAQVRSAIFFIRPMVGPRATFRTATANWNGTTLNCILLSQMSAAKSATGGRHWSESEYCIDNASGALITYSPAPGLYVLYDYSQAIHFHDRLIPNKLTVTQAGHTIIEAQTASVSDPPNDPSLFQTAGLSQVGVGSLMTAPWNFRSVRNSALVPAGSAQIVVLHGMQSAAGAISDVELLASSNSALNASALETVSQLAGHATSDGENGATPQSHEVLVTLTFVGNQQ